MSTPETTPVAWMYERNGVNAYFDHRSEEYASSGLGFTETPLYAHPPLANKPTERALVEALKALCAHFEAQNPMRTADLHPTVCNCIRCDYDRAAALLAALKAHGETVA